MRNLWAPWREKYITRLTLKAEIGCFICNAQKSKKDIANLVIARNKYAFVMMNLYPYNNGHLLICPNKHTTSLRQLKKEEMLGLFELTFRMKDILDGVLKPHGYNIGFNIGKFAGAGIDHIHMHIVPRWKNDTNFMPVISGTKVISQTLKGLGKLLRKEASNKK